MKEESYKELFSLLLKVYNYTIQTYYRFPEVIIYGKRRLEREEFELLRDEGYLTAYYSDSFGKLYRLSKKAETFLLERRKKRKRKNFPAADAPAQCSFQFL